MPHLVEHHHALLIPTPGASFLCDADHRLMFRRSHHGPDADRSRHQQRSKRGEDHVSRQGLTELMKLRLVDVQTAKSMILVTLPLWALGSILALYVSVTVLKVGYGIAMLGLAYLLLSDQPEPMSPPTPVVRPVGATGREGGGRLIGRTDQAPPVLIVAESEHVHAACASGEHRRIVAASGRSMTSEPCLGT
jgi:hypothetical protein